MFLLVIGFKLFIIFFFRECLISYIYKRVKKKIFFESICLNSRTVKPQYVRCSVNNLKNKVVEIDC